MVLRLESRIVGAVPVIAGEAHRGAVRCVGRVVAESEKHAAGDFKTSIGIDEAAGHVGGASVAAALLATHAREAHAHTHATALAFVALAGNLEDEHAAGHLGGPVRVEHVDHVTLRGDVVVTAANHGVAAGFAEHGISTGVFLGTACCIPAVVGCECCGNAALGKYPVCFKAFVSRNDVNRGALQVQGGIRMDTVILRTDGHVAGIHANLPMGMQAVVVRFHVDGAAVDVDVLAGDKALAGRFDLDFRFHGGIAYGNVVGGLDAVITSLDGDIAAADFNKALALDDVDAGIAVVFLAFVAFKAVALLGGEVQGAAGNLEASLTLDGVFGSDDGDFAILDLEIVGGLDAVLVNAWLPLPSSKTLVVPLTRWMTALSAFFTRIGELELFRVALWR